jgi:hypothetical protein
VIEINEWKETCISGAKRANLDISTWLPDWFVGSGKDESCQFEGTWWDMICFARNVLASENTKQCCPEYYHPEYAIHNYCGEEIPYIFERKKRINET